MAIDPSIALGVKPVQFESPINQMAKIYELQNAAQSNQLNKLKMDEYTRGVAEDAEIKNALARLDKNSPTYEQDRFNAYALKGIEGVKAYAATKKEEAAAEEHAFGAKGKKLANTEASVKLAKAAQNDILEYPSEAMVTSYYEDAKRKGYYDPETLSNIERFTKLVLSVPAPIDPATGEPDFTARRQAITRLQLEAKDRLGKPGQRDVGGSVQDIMADPITGKTIVTGTAKKTATPGEILSASNQRATQAETARHNVVMEGQGKIPAGYRLLSDGSLETIPGGPADAKTKVAEAGQSTVDSLAATLNGYYDKLSQGGGIVSSNKRIGTNLGSSVQSSGLGQFVGGAVGTENQTTRQNILNARPLLLQAIMKATGMSAKQMDSNQELKLYLSAATDPSKSLESNKEALDNLVRLYGVGGEATPGGAKTKPIMPRNEKMPSSNPHANKSDAQIKKELGIK